VAVVVLPVADLGRRQHRLDAHQAAGQAGVGSEGAAALADPAGDVAAGRALGPATLPDPGVGLVDGAVAVVVLAVTDLDAAVGRPAGVLAAGERVVVDVQEARI